VRHRLLYIKVDLKPIAESNLFDFQIGLQKGDLLIYRAERTIVVSQHMPKDFGQSDYHFLSRLGLSRNQRCDTI